MKTAIELISLKEFQSSLTRRLAQKDSVDFSAMMLAAIAGGKNLLFDMQEITEVTPISSIVITRVPDAGDFIVGAVMIHGKYLCVLDIPLVMTGKMGDREGGYILTVNPKFGLDAGYLVDRVENMKLLSEMSQSGSFFVDGENNQWELVDVQSISPNDDFYSLKE